MPIYEYECEACGAIDEVLQKYSDKPLKKCRHCSGKVHKLISHSTFHLKGGGWYVTDYANKSRNTSGSTGKQSKSDDATAKKETPKAKKTED